MDMIGGDLTLFAVVRHPIDRFLSGYVDKCMKERTYFTEKERCFGCQNDMRCFVDHLHEVFINHSRGGDSGRTGDPVSRSVNHYYIRHFAPQTW
ncbi:hypothetical protein GCK32_021608 [Trichostrongylus colubriformis]|uniref:Sulfotransferase n=1 Tax=Trichostrongylus colubriformis TaxID=6319 RepID=A0AAN8F7B5_TRICO